jgi:ketosteroid isomerase-like protein
MTQEDGGFDLERIAAELEIREVLARYCRAVDRGDRDGIAAVYHPDAHDDHGPFTGSPADFADYIVAKFDACPHVGQHHVTNVLVELDGDAARVESYFLALNPQAPEKGGGHDLVGGRYLDRFERRDGRWLIADRRVVLDVTRDALAGSAWPSGPFAAGARRGDDPSAGFFRG